MQKKVLKVLIISLCISALLGVIIVLTGGYGELEGKILGTTLTVFLFSTLSLCCATIYDNPKYKTFSTIGVITCIIACLWSVLIIWGLLNVCIMFCNGYNLFGRVLWSLIVMSSSAAHISLLLLQGEKNNIVNKIVKLTIYLSIIIDVMILLIAWDIVAESDLYGRLVSAIAIIIVLGTIVSPIINKIYKKNYNKTKID